MNLCRRPMWTLDIWLRLAGQPVYLALVRRLPATCPGEIERYRGGIF